MPSPLDPPLMGNGTNCTPARSSTRLRLVATWKPTSQAKFLVVMGRTFSATSIPALRSRAALAGFWV
jgi:hypothetical protein